MTQIVRRSTKHTNDVMAILKSKHHATNAEIAQELRNIHPEVSDTTVHRINSAPVRRRDNWFGAADQKKVAAI